MTFATYFIVCANHRITYRNGKKYKFILQILILYGHFESFQPFFLAHFIIFPVSKAYISSDQPGTQGNQLEFWSNRISAFLRMAKNINNFLERNRKMEKKGKETLKITLNTQ